MQFISRLFKNNLVALAVGTISLAFFLAVLVLISLDSLINTLILISSALVLWLFTNTKGFSLTPRGVYKAFEKHIDEFAAGREAKRESEASSLVARGKELLDIEAYADAVYNFEKAHKLTPTQEIGELLAESKAKRDEQIVNRLVLEGRQDLESGDHVQALQTLEQARVVASTREDISELASQAKDALYTEAVEALKDHRFSEAVEKLEQVVSFDPTFRDAKQRLETAKEPVVTVSVPPDTKWQPAQAEEFITMLYALRVPIVLRTVATSEGIRWVIQMPHKQYETVTRSVLAFYPMAEIFDRPPLEELPKAYNYGATQGFHMPFMYAAELTTIDPLAPLVGAMSNLRPDEEIVYQVRIMPSRKDYNLMGRSRLKKSGFKPEYIVGGKSGVLAAGVSAFTTEKKYEGRYHNIYEEKVSSSLAPVFLSLQVRCPDKERRRAFLDALQSALNVFNREGGNRVTYRETKSTMFGLGTSQRGNDLVLSTHEVAALWHLPTEHIKTQGVVWGSGIKAPLPVELHLDKGDTLLGFNHYQGVTRPVFIADFDRVTHCNLFGRTRVGKSTLMHNMIHQSIELGHGVGVIDPHGDLVKDVLECSIPPDREGDVVLFDLSDTDHPMPLNMLHVPPGVPKNAAVGLTLGVLQKIFADQWSATRMEDALYSALAVLVEVPGATIRDLQRLFTDAEYRFSCLARLPESHAAHEFFETYNKRRERDQMQIVEPILYRIRRFYRNPAIEKMITAPTSLDFRRLMDSKKIFLASLAGEETKEEANTIGATLVSQIQMAAMSRANVPKDERQKLMFFLYIDEVQNFTTSSLPVIYSEAAKYALSLCCANQFLSQLEGATLDAVMGNTGTSIMFACGQKDSQALGRYVQPVFDGQSLLNLDRFQTVVKMQQTGRTLPAFSMMTPLPPERPDNAEEIADRIRDLSRATYTSPPASPEKPAEPEEKPEQEDADAGWYEVEPNEDD